jgi:hypothetical protein
MAITDEVLNELLKNKREIEEKLEKTPLDAGYKFRLTELQLLIQQRIDDVAKNPELATKPLTPIRGFYTKQLSLEEFGFVPMSMKKILTSNFQNGNIDLKMLANKYNYPIRSVTWYYNQYKKEKNGQT